MLAHAHTPGTAPDPFFLHTTQRVAVHVLCSSGARGAPAQAPSSEEEEVTISWRQWGRGTRSSWSRQLGCVASVPFHTFPL